MSTITVFVNTSEEAMVGGEGWGSYDPESSVSKFLARLESHLSRIYPDCEVTVESGLKFDVEMDDDNEGTADQTLSEYDVDRIRHELDIMWEAGEWLVE
jgi:hypothetical protein